MAEDKNVANEINNEADKSARETQIPQEDTKDSGTDIEEQEASKNGKSTKIKWVIAAVAVLILLVMAVGYCVIANYYKDKFFKNTFINGMACGDMGATEVATYLNSQAPAFHLEVIGRDKAGAQIVLGTVEAEDIAYAYADVRSAVQELLDGQNKWLWITSLGSGSNGYSIVQDVTYDEAALKNVVMNFPAFQKENMVEPKDAYISEYSEENKNYRVIPEVKGNKFDAKKAYSCIEAALMGDSANVDVTVDLAELGCYEEPKVFADDAKLNNSVDTINKWLCTEIKYLWNDKKILLDSSVIKEWVSMENDEPVLNEEAIADFVNENADACDTAGKYTNFTTAAGTTISLPRLSYGWNTNREEEIAELTELIKSGSKQEREPVYWRKGVWRGWNDIGNSYIEADITNQHLYVFEKGAIVFETDFVSGEMSKPDCVSPAGIFGLTYKTLNATLRGADYVTPVTYWMPFYGNFGMHDATWRTEFGGDFYITGQGSHGCLNLPLESAALIYNYVFEGSPIICYY